MTVGRPLTLEDQPSIEFEVLEASHYGLTADRFPPLALTFPRSLIDIIIIRHTYPQKSSTMRTGTALLFFLATAAYGADAFAPPSSTFASRAPISLAMSTKEKEDTKKPPIRRRRTMMHLPSALAGTLTRLWCVLLQYI